ncbi:CHAT domain-containing protein [Actinoplanes bogorensis]|uniref:CHAT domain-containing protein n=1 Tax=Paractinoplanes bogorensis TaxID=1610840 RepID=A0ABS5YUK0_9ACTN|nr:CHAT domain-containing protein [Actinoplanes bogorensis]MBU2666378.1 CHAT domain-containing protein [Actinoplanes bogorensis]
MTEAFDLLIGRSGAPEPSLLAWIARNADPADWPRVLLAAERFGGLESGAAWPAIGLAVQEIAIAYGQAEPSLPAWPELFTRDLGGLLEEEVAWILPEAPAEHRAEFRRSALSEIEQALLSGLYWYAALLISHLAPYLGSLRDRAGRLVAQLASGYWRGHLIALAGREVPAGSATEEVDQSHPAAADLDRAARDMSVGELRDLCRLALSILLGDLPADADYLAHPHRSVREWSDRTEPLAVEDAPARWVNNGIADPVDRTPRPPDRTLRVDTGYLFWFEIADAPHPSATVREPVEFELPDDVAEGAILRVTLTSRPGELVVEAGRETGELVVGADGRVRVARSPDGSAASGSRLFFPIRTPAQAGRHQLRCNLHYGGRILQSRTLTAIVDEAERVQQWALETTVDFYGGQALDGAALAAMEPIDLSIMVDDRAPTGGQTGLVVAQGAEVAAVTMPIDELQEQVERTRYALRTVSHLNKKQPRPGDFKYDDYEGASTVGPAMFQRDLELLARRGFDAWVELGFAIADSFERSGRAELLSQPGPPGDEDSALWRLSAWLRQPRVIEMANVADFRILVPATMIYDRPLALRGALQICGTFQNALATHANLSAVECFRGNCPSWGDKKVLCPSGFWGFRHLLGSPQSVGPLGGAATGLDLKPRKQTITYSGRPRCAVGRAAAFGREHPLWVSRLGDGSLPVRTDAERLLDDLRRRDPEPHLVYFYCHGDFSDGMPVLQFDEAGADQIAATELAAYVRWPTSRPLVFLNACRSIATEPEHASSFINALIRRAGASGMVGTEIITYERLAATFAEQVLNEFVTHGRPIGEAMRTARLTLLSRGNPLGLIYTAYAPPHLAMRSDT